MTATETTPSVDAVSAPETLPAVRGSSGAVAGAGRGLATPTGPDADELIRRVNDIYEAAMDGYPVFDKDGNHLADVAQLAVANKAVELLMRAAGMFDRHDTLDATVALEITINGVDASQLR